MIGQNETEQLMHLFLVTSVILVEEDDEDEPIWPKEFHKLSFSNFGVGRGKLKKKRDQFQSSNQYSKLLKQPSLFYPLTHTTYEQFNFICNSTTPLVTKIKSLDWRNKVLLTLRWAVHYPSLAELCHCFNISLFVSSEIIKETLFILAEYFQTFVPNTIENIDSLPKSELSSKICFIIDGTITFVQRKSFAKYSRADKHGKFVQTILIVDYTGLIYAFHTNVMGHLSDNSVPKVSKLFHSMFDSKDVYCISDTGFSNVSYVTHGYRLNQLKTENIKIFDTISRREQKMVEHVNGHLKNFSTFRNCKKMEEEKFIHIVFIAVGLYNFKKINFFLD
jgi:hypothetical protein